MGEPNRCDYCHELAGCCLCYGDPDADDEACDEDESEDCPYCEGEGCSECDFTGLYE